MSCENGLELIDAQKRILDLELLVAFLYEKIKVLELQNSALQEPLCNLKKHAVIKAQEESKALCVGAQESAPIASSSSDCAAGIVFEPREDQTPLEIEQAQTTDQLVSFASELFLSTETRKEKGDLSHYSRRHVALKIMYMGARFHGFASEASSQRTVESDLFMALEKTKLIIGGKSEAKYTRCGRTDKGVSANGQVVALLLRSCHKDSSPVSMPEEEDRVAAAVLSRSQESQFTKVSGINMTQLSFKRWNSVTDGMPCFGTGNLIPSGTAYPWPTLVLMAMGRQRLELKRVNCPISDHEEIDYVGVLNRALPPDIRIFGWCYVPYNFHARFSCLSREYNYFFINDGFDIEAMKVAARKFCGEHDFRNFCKMDADNVHNFRRVIYSFDILPCLHRLDGFELWMFQVKGTAFLWHQVRCMVAVLLMIGQKKESPTVVDDLLDIQKTSRKPQYVMAPESSLVLQSCNFQGLSFYCPSGAKKFLQAHFRNLMSENLVAAGMLKQISYHLSDWDTQGHPKDWACRKSSHVPLLCRPTEPTYDERRKKLLNKKQHSSSSLSLLPSC